MITLRPGDDGFERARSELSATAGTGAARPSGIVRARSVDDVVAAVLAAGSGGSQVTVRSGGHSLSGTHLRDGAVAVDLRDLNSCTVDPDRRLVTVGPGATSSAAADVLAAAGLTFPVGHSPAVGLGGFLLAGGNGWAVAGQHPASHRVLGATVVLGDGSVRAVVAGTDTNADNGVDAELMWAVRGAGPAFPGIVTEFTLAVEPAGPVVLRHVRTVPGSAAALVGAALDALEPLPGTVEVTVVARPAADGGTLMITATGFPTENADSTPGFDLVVALDMPTIDVAPARAFDSPAAVLADLPDHAGDGQLSHHVWAVGGWQATLSALPLDLPGPSDRCSVLVSRAPITSAALPDGGVGALYRPPTALGVAAYAHFSPGDPVQTGRAWAHRMVAGLGGTDPRRYVGEADLTAGRAAVEQSFPAGAIPRLERLRAAVDPHRVIASVLD